MRGAHFKPVRAAEGDQPLLMRGRVRAGLAWLDRRLGWDLASTVLCVVFVAAGLACGVVWLAVVRAAVPLSVPAGAGLRWLMCAS
jgi:hypothetical protein